MVNSFLMRTGLPIYADGSGYDRNWGKKRCQLHLAKPGFTYCYLTKKSRDANTEDEVT
ncbi:hypothetical protein [Bacteroides acidifaciens]|uniref:hypothetical protein n=1 Tax=Bacteroides acidifaciens TaxID=85831 RepID=UPI003F69226B